MPSTTALATSNPLLPSSVLGDQKEPTVRACFPCLPSSTRCFTPQDIKQPDPIPAAGIQEAVGLMEAGRIYRYNVGSAEESVVSQCEKEIGAYTGHKYVVALNSCGSALFLALKCAGVMPGDKILTNAFTFTAVPSAIEVPLPPSLCIVTTPRALLPALGAGREEPSVGRGPSAPWNQGTRPTTVPPHTTD